MPAIAKMGGNSNVTCTDGAQGSGCAPGKHHWDSGTTQTSDQGSGNVFVNGIGVVRNGDTMGSHPDGVPCVASPVNHAPALSTYSGNVFANGKEIGRVGDKYDSDGHFDHTVATGSANVFAN